MLTEQGNFRQNALKVVLIICLLSSGHTLSAATLAEQREQFLDAKVILRAGKLTTFTKISKRITDYPLYPYLIYDYLRPRLSSAKDSEIISFLKRYADLPVANDLRRAWLKILARKGRWQVYLDNYVTQKDAVLQCYQLLARIRTGNETFLLEDARTMWLTGTSQPSQCDLVFDRLNKSDFMTDELVWQRIHLAMNNSEISLAKYLSRKLPATDQKWVSRWIATYHNPARWTKNPDIDDNELSRIILTQGIIRLAKSDINTAIPRWKVLKEKFTFNQDDILKIERTLAIHAVIKKHPRSKELLDDLDNLNIDEDIFHWRLREALDNANWPALVKWTDGEIPRDESIRLRWMYWRTRALEKVERNEDTEALYHLAAVERDYYGFLAADRIEANYNISHISLPEDLETWQTLSDLPVIQRAKELFILNSKYLARREWNHAVSSMTTYQKQIAAMIAANWGWHDRLIITLGGAKAYDDLVLRFPMAFENEMKIYAVKRNLDLEWMYALTRAESAFMVDAKSPSGALGLMQVMPATGKETAKSIGFKTYSNRYLLEADKNITIGSAYLRQMFDRFGNTVVATAAYNAGPNAVAKWLPKIGCLEPDIWAEQIPYDETRKHVSRIMFFATIYDWRLQNNVKRFNQRMATIQPNNNNVVTSLSCTESTISKL